MANSLPAVELDTQQPEDSIVTHRLADGGFVPKKIARCEQCRAKVDLGPLLYWVIIASGLVLFYVFGQAEAAAALHPDLLWLILVLVSISIPLRKSLPTSGPTSEETKGRNRWNLIVFLIQMLVIESAFIREFLTTVALAQTAENQTVVTPGSLNDPRENISAAIMGNAMLCLLYVAAVLPSLFTSDMAVVQESPLATPSKLSRKRCQLGILTTVVLLDTTAQILAIVYWGGPRLPPFRFLITGAVLHLAHRTLAALAAFMLVVKQLSVTFVQGLLPLFRLTVVLAYTAACFFILVERSELSMRLATAGH
jgi:hypothetical protein